MKVLLLTENWAPQVGGIQNYLFHIATGLPKDSVVVTEPHTQRFYWPLVKPKWYPLYWKLLKQAKREKYDAILCGKALFEGLLAYRLKQKLGISYVIFTYAMEIETWAANSKTRRKLGIVLKHADRIVYINEVTKQKLVDLGASEKQLVKIWPGVGDEHFAAVSDEQKKAVLEKYKLKQPYILCVSRLIERKGINLLIEAFAKLDQTRFSEVRLVIVGDGPLRHELETLTHQLFIHTSVSFLGSVPDDELHALYAGAHLFALTPRPVKDDIEGFGIVYLEANAAGLPVIATNTGGVAEAVVDNQTGLVVAPDSVSDIRKALAYLLSHNDERSKMGEQGKKRAWNEFRWSKRILLVKGMLDALLAGKVLKN